MATARPQVAAVTAVETETRAYVDWPAVIAGTVVAAALTLVLLTFGSAIGLSMVSPYEGRSASKWLFALALGLWTLWVIVSCNLAGGYIAGRMRRRVGDASERESDIRDGVHGLAVWGIGVLLGAIMSVIGVTALATGGAKLAGAAVSAAGDQARNDPMGYTIDSMFRAGPQGVPAGAAQGGDNEAAKREVARILATGTAGQPIADDDKAYVGRLVAARTGLSQEEAQRRVDDALAKAKETANAARKTGIVTGFLLAAALLAGAASAWLAAIMGGRHRDQNTDVSGFPFR